MNDKSIRDVVCQKGKTGALSQANHIAINNPTLWRSTRAGARSTMIKAAVSSGIPWRRAVEELRNTPEVRLSTTEQVLLFSGSAMHACSRPLRHDLVMIGLLYIAYPDGCWHKHTHDILAEAKALPCEGASVLV